MNNLLKKIPTKKLVKNLIEFYTALAIVTILYAWLCIPSFVLSIIFLIPYVVSLIYILGSIEDIFQELIRRNNK